MTLDHYGAYVAQFDVSWDEFTFDQNGKEVLTHKTWEGSGKDKQPITLQLSLFHQIQKYKNRCKRMYRSCMGMVENYH